MKTATTAATLGELQSLVSDLQSTESVIELPELSSRRLPSPDREWGLRAAIGIYVTPEFGNSGYIELNGDGSVKRVSYPHD